jgi:hypothetical protein
MHDVIIIGADQPDFNAFWCDELGLDTLVLEQRRDSAATSPRYNPMETTRLKARNGKSCSTFCAVSTLPIRSWTQTSDHFGGFESEAVRWRVAKSSSRSRS